MAIRRILLTLLVWVCFSFVFAQDLPGFSKTLTTADGLPNSTITGLLQDRVGFIWIGTADGLVRYDGHGLKIFRNRSGDTTSLADNKIVQLEETSQGQFLIGMESGNFQLFDPITERFMGLLDERFLAAKKATVTQCHLSADGRHIWGLMPGVRLIHYDRSLKTVAVFDLLSLVGETNVMTDFVLTASGYVYGTSSKGLFQLNTRTGHKRFIPHPFKLRTSGFSSDGHDVVEAPNGEIVLFGYENVVLYNPVQNRFRTVPLPNPINGEFIYYSLKTLSDNRLYINYMNRLYRLEANDQLTLLQTNAANDKVNACLLDRSGVLWAKAQSGGLTRRELNPPPFHFRPNRKSFIEDLIEQDLGIPVIKDLTVWQSAWWPRYTTAPNNDAYLIDPSRVYRYQSKNQEIEEIESLRITNKDVCCKLCLKVTPTGHVWIYANTQGLIETDADGGHKKLYPNSRLPLKGPYPGYDATDIQPMGNSVWVGSTIGLGLFQYDLRKQRFVRQFRNDPKNPNSLPYNTLTCLKPDPFDPAMLWIGTAGGGLCQLNTRTFTFRRLGEAEGFPDSNIQSIETDRQGFLWCSTNHGLVRLNPKTRRWRHFTTSDGLLENEFSHTSSAALPDGRLVFGSPGGRTVFNPLAIRDDSYEPTAVLTSLKINNVPAEANRIDSPIPAPINALDRLTLDYTQNFLTFEFAGLQFIKPDKIQYRYRLTNVDQNWVETGTQNMANYTQLQPGDYTFEVMATNAMAAGIPTQNDWRW
jgi:ligand-binding sensor domain-containing protein